MSGVRMTTALFERLMKIHSNPPILYHGFKSVFFLQTRPQTHKSNEVTSLRVRFLL